MSSKVYCLCEDDEYCEHCDPIRYRKEESLRQLQEEIASIKKRLERLEKECNTV